MQLRKVLPAGALSLALAFAVAGCGDSTGTGSNTITMTNAEALEMYGEINSALAGANFSADRAAVMGGPQLSRVMLPSFNSTNAAVSITATVSCVGGGTVGVSGSDNASGTSSTFDITESFNTCKTTHFTLGGSLNYKGSLSETASSFNFSLTIAGDVSVSATDGRSGNCHMDVTVTETGTLQAPTVTVSGTICGIQANAVITAANA